jgi:hypothetical protein
MEKEELLKLYETELYCNVVNEEDLIEFDRALSLDWSDDKQSIEVENILSRTHKLFEYFKSKVLYPKHSLSAFFTFEVKPSRNVDNLNTFKNMLRGLLYTNAFKKINT